MNELHAGSEHLGLSIESLKEIPDSLELILNRIPGMLYRSESCFPWRMGFVSAGCKAVSGFEAPILPEKRIMWGHIIHTDDVEYVKKVVAEAVGKDQSFDMEYRISTSCGDEKWVWDRGCPVRIDRDERVFLDGFITDITDRKKAEIDLLREQAYSRAIVDTANEAVISISEEGHIQTVNPVAQAIFGYQADELKEADWRVLLSAQHENEYASCLEQCLNETEPTFSCHTRELIARKKDGTLFPIQVSVSEMKHQCGRMFVCLIRDISVQRRAEEEAREHREKLARVDRLTSLGEMASGIAHEINQPLTAISLFSQVGKRYLASQQYDRLSEIFDKLTVQAQRAGNIVERMQSMTRQHDSVREKIECNDTVKEIATLAEAESWIRDIPIELQLGEGLPTLFADKVQIQQVVLNLLRNGMESMVSAHCKAGESIRLITRVNDNGDAEVMVIDSGQGVEDEEAEQIFKPFSTSKRQGMGMGLSISRAIVAAHGGQLSFSNNVTGGATFRFTLPSAI